MVKLSPAEQAVLALLAEGHDSHADIAALLCVERQTISTHLYNLHRKTGTANDVQLLRWAFREAQRADRLERLKGAR